MSKKTLIHIREGGPPSTKTAGRSDIENSGAGSGRQSDTYWYQPQQLGQLRPSDIQTFDNTVQNYIAEPYNHYSAKDIKDLFFYNPDYRKTALDRMYAACGVPNAVRPDGAVTVYRAGFPVDPTEFNEFTLNPQLAHQNSITKGLPVYTATVYPPAVLGYSDLDQTVFVLPEATESKK